MVGDLELLGAGGIWFWPWAVGSGHHVTAMRNQTYRGRFWRSVTQFDRGDLDSPAADVNRTAVLVESSTARVHGEKVGRGDG